MRTWIGLSLLFVLMVLTATACRNNISPGSPFAYTPTPSPVATSYVPIITTVAGNGTRSYSGDGGPASSSVLDYPNGLVFDGSGNLYIADSGNNRIRMINLSGIISTVAGSTISGYAGDGLAATSAELNFPTGIAVDGSGNIYIADTVNNRIRFVNTGGIISTIAGNGTAGYTGDTGAATAAEINWPRDVKVDAAGNVYIADYLNGCVRKVNAGGVITTIVGTGTAGFSGDGGPASSAQISNEWAIGLDSSGNLYVADAGNNRLRKVNTSGVISTIAGNGLPGFSGDGGPATAAELFGLLGVAVDGAGNIYIGDTMNERVRKIDTSGVITTVAGSGATGYSGDGGPAIAADLYEPREVAVNSAGNLFFSDNLNHAVREVKFH
jgi:sugar lactone lactonase YvrE